MSHPREGNCTAQRSEGPPWQLRCRGACFVDKYFYKVFSRRDRSMGLCICAASLHQKLLNVFDFRVKTRAHSFLFVTANRHYINITWTEYIIYNAQAQEACSTSELRAAQEACSTCELRAAQEACSTCELRAAQETYIKIYNVYGTLYESLRSYKS